MKKNSLFYLFAVLLGLISVIVLLFAAETAARLNFNDRSPFGYLFNPRLLAHAAVFNRSPLPSPQDEQPRIFCLGGSTTHGCRVPIKASYPVLSNLLLKNNNKPGTVYNFGANGVSGVATNYLVKNLVAKYSPQCIILHDGYNDLPIVIKKLPLDKDSGKDRYSYIAPDYTKPYNPYIENGLIRYINSFKLINLRGIRKSISTIRKKIFNSKGSDLYLGFDYYRYPLLEGSEKDILAENKKRIQIFIEKESDTIEYCLRNNIKVIVILEPYIKPLHAPRGTGLRDIQTGFILSQCHRIQQQLYSLYLVSKYRNNDNIRIIDMRTVFKDKYDELFYDECHLNARGNFIKAMMIYRTLTKLF